MFPEILGNRNDKYNNASLFLLTRYGIINPSFRDMFSAGGQVDLPRKNGVLVKMPAAFGRIKKYKNLILKTLRETSEQTLAENWNAAVDNENRIVQWCSLCAKNYAANKSLSVYDVALEVLEKIFLPYSLTAEKYIFVAES